MPIALTFHVLGYTFTLESREKATTATLTSDGC